ncbi:MAG: hypothetical protein V4773_01245, partial [Verrucomicrobiota bacterium]
MLSSLGFARLTEKEDELVKRFGPFTNRSAESASFEGRSYVVGTWLTFKADQWTIRTLVVEDRCAQIVYSKVGSWTDEQIVSLLDRNGGHGTYKEEN